MGERYTKEQKNKLYPIALDVLSTYNVDNPLVSKFINKLIKGIPETNIKLVENKPSTASRVVSNFASQLKGQSQEALTPMLKSLTQELKKSLFNSITKQAQQFLYPNSSFADIKGSTQALDLIRVGNTSQQAYKNIPPYDQQTPNSALADIKGSTQSLDLIRDLDKEKNSIIDGITDKGKRDLKDSLKGVLECVCDNKRPQSTPQPSTTPTGQPRPQGAEQKKPEGIGVFDKILIGTAVAAAVAEALKRFFTAKPGIPEPISVPAPQTPIEVPAPQKPVEVPAPQKPIEVPAPQKPVEVPVPTPEVNEPVILPPPLKPAPKPPVEVPKPAPKPPVEVPKPPVEVPKPAPKPPVEVPKPAPKPPVEVPKPAPKPPVEVPKPAPKPPVEVPKPAPNKIPRLDEVVPIRKIPLPAEPSKPWLPKEPSVNKPPYKPTPKLEEVIPKVKIPPKVASSLEKEAVEVGAKSAEKIAVKAGTKQVIKTVSKKVPFGVGALIAGGLAADRAIAGDWEGAGLELASGAASIIPVAGTATSLAIDGVIYSKDLERLKTPGDVPETKPEQNKEFPAPKPSTVPAPTPSIETPKPAVEAPKPEPEPAPKPAVEAPKPEPEPEPAPKPAVEAPKPEPEPEPAPKPAVEAPKLEPESKPAVEAPKPEPEPAPKPAVEAPKPEPEPAPKPAVEAPRPKPVISAEEAEQIKKNVESQVKNLNLDPKYLLASTESAGSITPKQPTKTNLLTPGNSATDNKEQITDTSKILLHGITESGKKEIIKLVTAPLNRISKSLQTIEKQTTTLTNPLNKNSTSSQLQTESKQTEENKKPLSFTNKLIDALPENKFTKPLKVIDNIRRDVTGTKERLKQNLQNRVLEKVSSTFNSQTSPEASTGETLFNKVTSSATDKLKGKLPSNNFLGRALENSPVKSVGKLFGKDSGKLASKALSKTVGKSLLKKIPLVGALAGLGFAGGRLLSGDFKGAALEAASGLAGTIPGVGTATSVGIDAALAAKDIQTPVEQVGDAAKLSNTGVKSDGGLVIKSPRENSLFKPIQLSKNDGFIAAPFAKENKVDTQGIAKDKDMQLPVLQDILKGTEGNNEYLARLADAIFNLAKNAGNNHSSVSQPIIMQQSQTAPPQRSAAQIANANVDPIRIVRSRFNV